MKMYGIKNCDSVKKAQKYLNSHQVEFEFIDFRDSPIDEATLLKFVEVLGWEKVINKRSTSYRNLTETQKNNVTIELILKNPTLIKRPVLVTGADIRVGFSEKSYLDLI